MFTMRVVGVSSSLARHTRTHVQRSATPTLSTLKKSSTMSGHGMSMLVLAEAMICAHVSQCNQLVNAQA